MTRAADPPGLGLDLLNVRIVAAVRKCHSCVTAFTVIVRLSTVLNDQPRKNTTFKRQPRPLGYVAVHRVTGMHSVRP